MPEPKTPLHWASAEAKQLWSVAVLALMARASTRLRLAIVALLVLATTLTLPPRLWRPQLARLAGLCSVVFVFTAIGADSVAPVTADRSLPAAAAATSAGEAALPASMAQAGAMRGAVSAAASYSYTLFHCGFITITRRSLALAVAFAGMSFVALQSARCAGCRRRRAGRAIAAAPCGSWPPRPGCCSSFTPMSLALPRARVPRGLPASACSLCLVSTPPERMALAVGRVLAPLGLLGLPVRELVLTVLLSLRFMATVFEEARNLCLGLASRGVDWRLQGFRGGAALFIAAGTKLFSNLMARCDAIAQAMAARGFAGPAEHRLQVAALGQRQRRVSRLADVVLLSSVVVLGLAACVGL